MQRNIEKRKRIIIMACLLICAMLAGCGKSKESSDISDKQENKADKIVAASEQEPKEEKPEPSKKEEEKPIEEATKGVPNLLLFRERDYKWNESADPAITHMYTYLMLDGESADSNKALAVSIEDARDELMSKEKRAWNKDIKSIEENGLITFDESWITYLRRADENYLSFVTEYCTEGMFDDGAYTEYTAHSYYVESGKEIAFSDVVADEDAFYDLITDKMYESIDNSLQQYYSTEINIDKKTLKNNLEKYMKTGELAWTLDPFGVTCYLQAYTAAPFAESQVILFSEDTDNTIFKDEFRNSARNEWVIQVPGYVGSYIDVNDGGVPVYVRANEFYDYKEGYDEMYLSGMYVSNTEDWKTVPTTMPGGTDFYNIFLIHKDGNTVLMENHNEYDTSFINTYVLARHEVREADTIRGCLEWASKKDYDINGDGYTPVYVPTDPSKIRVLTGKGDYAEDWSPTVINVDTKGNLEVPSDLSDKSEKTGSEDEYRVYYYLYNEGDNVESTKDKVILYEVSCENVNDEDDEGPLDLIIDTDTVFDESCDTSFFDGYQKGDTPLEWIHHARELENKEPDRGPLLIGVYEVSLTGSHVDRYYGAYWWD